MSGQFCGVCKRPFTGLFRDHSNETCISAVSLDRNAAESQLKAAQAENARLREALEVAVCRIADMLVSEDFDRGTLGQYLEKTHKKLKAALSHEAGEGDS